MIKFLFSVVIVSKALFGFDMAGIAGSVDTDKAVSSVDTEKAVAAAAKGTDVTMEDVSKSVDTDKAVESVDQEKLMKSVVGF